MMSDSEDLLGTVVSEVLRDVHRYSPGLGQRQAALIDSDDGTLRRWADLGRDRSRDLVERAAARAGFIHRHFDPEEAAARLQAIMAMATGLQATYALLGDDQSKRAMIDLLKLRVLGPFHSPLPLTPEAFRAHQAHVDRAFRLQRGTFEVSDPWFSPLSLYRVPVDTSGRVTLHAHSVDLVSVYLLGQYSYRGQARVEVEAGDVVLDVGGCWGDTALYFAELVGPGGKVYTFEFDPENLRILRANLELNPQLAERIEVVERALWDRSGERLRFAPAGRCTVVSEGESEITGLEVEAITLDDFVTEAGIERVGFIKMDVEGAEPNVLRGARGTLERMAPKLAIAAYHKDDDLIDLPKEIPVLHSGYQLYLGTFSPVQEETVLFGRAPSATARRNST